MNPSVIGSLLGLFDLGGESGGLGGALLLTVATIGLTLLGLLGLGLGSGSDLGRLDLGIAAGLLDRIGHFDLALGVFLEDDILEFLAVLGGDDGLDPDLEVLVRDVVPHFAEVVPHGCFRLDGGGDRGTNFDGEGGDNGDVVLGHDLDLLFLVWIG